MKDWLINGINQYFDWLKKRTLVSEDETTGWSVISTPFTGLFNDTIDIFAKQTSDGRVILSDDGNTINNLELFGVVFKNTQGRKSIIERIKLNYGVTIVKDEITKTIAMSDFVQGKHDMLRAILELSDMVNLTTHRITSSFKKDDVKNLFNEKEMNVTPDFIVSGRSGIRFTFDYLIAKPKKETVIQVFNNFDKPNLATFLLGIDEVKYPRELLSSKKLEPIAIINDTEAKVREEYLEALRNRDMSYLFWSDHEKPEFISKLVA